MVASVLVLRGKPGSEKLAVVSSLIGTAASIGAVIAIMVDLGRSQNVLAMVVGGNFGSPLVGDMLALTAFIICSLVMSYLLCAPYAFASGRTELYPWVRKYESSDHLRSKLRGALRVVAVLGLICAVALQVVEGLIFALLVAHAWWNSFILPIDFLVVALMCGFSLLVGLGALLAGRAGFEKYRDTLSSMARLAGVVIIVHLVLAISELLIVLFAEGARGSMIVAELMTYWPLYLAELLLPLIAAMLFLMPRFNRQRTPLIVSGILVILGVFAHRMMLLYPAFNAVSLTVGTTATGELWEVPVSSGLNGGAAALITTTAYVPSLAEWGLVLLPLGFVIALVIGIGRYVRL